MRLFIFGAGHDSIDGVTAQDRIVLDASLGVADFAALMALARPAEGGDSTLFDFGGGNSLLLEDVRIGQITAAQVDLGADDPPTLPSPPVNGVGGAGNDRLTGTSGRDDLYGMGGNDVILGRGGNDDLYGGSGRDRLLGGGGHDELYGGSGDDTLDGGNGNDTLTGGAGADTFIYARGRDVIEDFGAGDVIVLDGALGVSGFADVLALARVVAGGDDVLINFGGGNRLVLEDVQLSQLSEGDFLFT